MHIFTHLSRIFRYLCCGEVETCRPLHAVGPIPQEPTGRGLHQKVDAHGREQQQEKEKKKKKKQEKKQQQEKKKEKKKKQEEKQQEDPCIQLTPRMH